MAKYCKCNLPIIDENTRRCQVCKRIVKSFPKARRVWRINPRTRIKENDKKYNRKRSKRKLKKRLKEEE